MNEHAPIRIVTSMDDAMYRDYGKAMVESTLEHWPGDLYLYYVGVKNKPQGIKKHPRLHLVNLNGVPGFPQFRNATAGFPIFAGRVHDQYDYRLNAHTFGIKPFAQMDCATDYDGLLFWLDADTRTVAPVTEEWLRGLFSGELMVYQGRPSWHSCASFVGWDCSHKQNSYFWLNYVDMLASGRFMLLPEWHDSFWLDALRDGLGLEATNIAPDNIGDGPVNVFDIVFSGRAYHYKGNKKKGPQRYAQLIDLIRQTRPAIVAEIGTWNGGRALEMAQAAPGLKYYGFDLFECASDATDAEEKNVKPHHRMDSVLDMLLKQGVDATLIQGNTRETLPQFIAYNPHIKADIVYIDGGHAVETIRSDYEHAKQMLAPGGAIIFDDYYSDMPEEELDRWGANRIVDELPSGDVLILPIIDPVKGGGGTQLAVVRG